MTRRQILAIYWILVALLLVTAGRLVVMIAEAVF